MRPLSVVPQRVPAAVVRRLKVADDLDVPVQQVAVDRVPAPHAVPRHIDPVGLRLMALQLENDELRAELDSLRSA